MINTWKRQFQGKAEHYLISWREIKPFGILEYKTACNKWISPDSTIEQHKKRCKKCADKIKAL